MNSAQAGRLALLCVAITSLGVIDFNPAYASNDEQADALIPGAICMARAVPDSETLAIIAPLAVADTMRAKGFVREECSINFDSADKRTAYRDGVCHMASTFRAEQTSKFVTLYGEQPAVLCGMAEVAISQWQFRARS